jgi:hypothetical protein
VGKRAVGPVLVMLLAVQSARAVEPVYEDVAAYVGVPARILYAMSQAESGLLEEGTFGPWPWTLNVAGTAKRYANREAMFDGLMAALGSGELKIDVGPMQVNWYWQFTVMGSPWRITDPTENLKVAAQILKTQYQRSGDWWEAVGHYHRPGVGPKDRAIAERYRQRVRHFYDKNSHHEAEPHAA